MGRAVNYRNPTISTVIIQHVEVFDLTLLHVRRKVFNGTLRFVLAATVRNTDSVAAGGRQRDYVS